MSALLGTFVSIKTMADGTPRLVLDLQCSLAEIAALNLQPGAPFGVARVKGQATVAKVEPEEHHDKPGQLCIMACTFSKDPAFWYWAGVNTQEEAKAFILERSGCESRKELDTKPECADAFHRNVRLPYLASKGVQ